MGGTAAAGCRGTLSWLRVGRGRRAAVSEAGNVGGEQVRAGAVPAGVGDATGTAGAHDTPAAAHEKHDHATGQHRHPVGRAGRMWWTRTTATGGWAIGWPGRTR